ncbi:cell wall hydrolase [Sphingomonas qomolangmaensis]|uniref:Cell wall hydrolase n=1 Tax=Sphingomonas qomolangmaensis TaxID=2918765 RepID=A0ABY5L9S8_9SPHN|nr:cell wall hydrolase [Sphingomonas qomolangmaensis]UUL83720.1 cell wall hydrolase [Sphingomonas qomolangmaensis]
MTPTPPPTTPVIRAILAVLALLAVLLPAIIVATAPRIAPVERTLARPSVRVIPPAELPPVEPTAFVAVDPADARSFNAAVPFSSAPNLPARAFRIIGTPDSIARGTDCLTAGMLYESGDDSVGQRAVAQVILNRVRHPAFPKSVCGVVFQGSERSTGCQFTFTCDGALARRYSDAAWGRARAVATAALQGRVDKRVGTATHYHTDWVVPYWSSSLDKISEVNTHLFFRWTGWWGTPPAFRGRYAGTEPVVPELAGIAASHGTGEVPAGVEDATVAATTIALADMPAPLPTDPNSFAITLDPRVAADQYAVYAKRLCGDRGYCKLLGWTERADTPAMLPAEPAILARMAFSYLRDSARGYERTLWNCDRFARPDRRDCMKRQVLQAPKRDATPAAAAATPAPPVPDLSGVRRRSGTLVPVPGPSTTPTEAPAKR